MAKKENIFESEISPLNMSLISSYLKTRLCQDGKTLIWNLGSKYRAVLTQLCLLLCLKILHNKN